MRPLDPIVKVPMPEPSSKLIGFAERDVRARPFKLLRTLIAKELKGADCNIIGVTSPSPHAGKSFIASNLAAAMSRVASSDTILVDLDLQRTSIAEIFEIIEPPGVTEYLLGETDYLSSIARQVEGTDLTIFPAFPQPLDSAELMAGERFSEFISALKVFGERSTIICDLPPLFVSDDAMLAAQHMDGLLMVVEQGVTTKKQLEASMQLLYPAKVIGTVFNRFSSSLGDPYGYSGPYGKYYN